MNRRTYTAKDIEEWVKISSQEILDRCLELESDGWQFVPGNNPNLPKTKKWKDYVCVKLQRVSHPNSGLSMSTLWAVKPKSITTEIIKQTSFTFGKKENA